MNGRRAGQALSEACPCAALGPAPVGVRPVCVAKQSRHPCYGVSTTWLAYSAVQRPVPDPDEVERALPLA